MIAHYTQAALVVDDEAPGRARAGRLDPHARRCRRTTSRWDGRRGAQARRVGPVPHPGRSPSRRSRPRARCRCAGRSAPPPPRGPPPTRCSPSRGRRPRPLRRARARGRRPARRERRARRGGEHGGRAARVTGEDVARGTSAASGTTTAPVCSTTSRTRRPTGASITVAPGATAPADAVHLARPRAAGLRQRPLPRLPPRPAGPPWGSGTFWIWRDAMYEVAGDPHPRHLPRARDRGVRRAAPCGVHEVGEFHYLHHDVDGSPYGDRNAMSRALVDAATRRRDQADRFSTPAT